MVFYFQRTLGVLVLLLCGFVNCWMFPRDEPVNALSKTDYNVLFSRQSSSNCASILGNPDTPACRAICVPSNYACSNHDPTRRSLEKLPSHGPIIRNESSETHRLSKRVWTVVTQAQLPTYMPNQFNGNFDTHFGAPIALVQTDPDGVETDATVVEQKLFDTEPFQVGAQSLHGCTMVCVVSRRAVHIGHYWEGAGWTSSSPTVFAQQVTNFFSGSGEVGVGSPLNPDLFNHPGDDARAYIMTPRRWGSTDYTISQYRRVSQLKSAIQAALPGIPIATWNYIPYDTATEGAQQNTNQRGIAIFQYDPNAYGPGLLGWRLLYEHLPFSSNRPAPGPGQLNGVPGPDDANAAKK